MQIETGLFDHMVLQRNRRGVSDTPVTGCCTVAGTVELCVSQDGTPLKDLDALPVGRARRGRFRAVLKGIPAGGPYHVELHIVSDAGEVLATATAKDVLVGDVWILGGQSNMQGCGLRKAAPPAHPMVRAHYMDDRWALAAEPIHNLWAAVDAVHAGAGPENKLAGVGPGVWFGRRMHELTGVPQGLLACAHGGTSMAQWDPKLKKLGGGSLFGATLRRLSRNGGRVAGVLWYQGESDALPETVDLYTPRMKALLAAFRREAGDAALPVVLVQLGRYISDGTTFREWSWSSIREQQRKLATALDKVSVVPAVDLQLDDNIHIGSRGQRVLGRRLADAMHVLRQGRRAGQPPLDVKGIQLQQGLTPLHTRVVVKFASVIGELQAGSRPVGFEIVDADGRAIACIHDILLQGDTATVSVYQPRPWFEDKQLAYGQRFDPVCTITDTEGRPVPAFGPLRIGKPRGWTGMVRQWRVSGLLPGAGQLHDMAYPAAVVRSGLRPRQFNSDLADLHLDKGWADGDHTVVYATTLHCPEPMRLTLGLGYDGPVKMWMDGREIMHDPDGVNPAWADRATVNVTGHGIHEIVIALGSNGGKAWGVMLRACRLDVTPKRLLAGDWVRPRFS